MFSQLNGLTEVVQIGLVELESVHLPLQDQDHFQADSSLCNACSFSPFMSISDGPHITKVYLTFTILAQDILGFVYHNQLFGVKIDS